MKRQNREMRRIWTRVTLGTAVLALVSVGGISRVRAQDAASVTDENVAQRIVDAKTPQDHEALAVYYHAQAAAAANHVKHHEAMLKSYDSVPGRSKAVMKQHCETLLASYRQEAKQYEQLAKDHEALAKSARGGKK